MVKTFIQQADIRVGMPTLAKPIHGVPFHDFAGILLSRCYKWHKTSVTHCYVKWGFCFQDHGMFVVDRPIPNNVPVYLWLYHISSIRRPAQWQLITLIPNPKFYSYHGYANVPFAGNSH